MAISLAALVGVSSLKLAKAGVAETTWNQDINWVAVNRSYKRYFIVFNLQVACC